LQFVHFLTNEQFGFIASGVKDGGDIREGKLAALHPVQNFYDGYERIKKRVNTYANVEGKGVSALYEFAPAQNHLNERYFLVDIEIALSGGTDRIDILLYDNEPIAKRQFCNSNGVGRLRLERSRSRLWGIAYAKMQQ
jgi:hypothetical protein